MTNPDISAATTDVRTARPLAAALAGLAALAVAMGIGRFAFTPILPMMLQDAGLTIAAGGWLASANYFGYLFGALSAAAIRLRPEAAIPGALLAVAITTLAMGLPLPFVAWLLLRFLAGVASSWVLISVSAWCMEALAVYRRPYLNSVVFAGVGFGIAVAGLLCIVLMRVGFGSGYAWTALGLLAGLVTVVIWRAFRPREQRVIAASSKEHRRYRWNAASVRMVIAYGIFGFGYIIPATFLPVMAKEALHGSSLFAWSWPVFGAAAMLSTLMVAPLVRLAGNRRLWMASQMVMAAGVVTPAVWPHLVSILIAALCVGGTFMVITLAALQEAKQIAGQDPTTLIAAMTSAFATGQIVGPLTVSASSGDGGFGSALVFAASLLVIGALLLVRKGEQASQQSST